MRTRVNARTFSKCFAERGLLIWPTEINVSKPRFKPQHLSLEIRLSKHHIAKFLNLYKGSGRRDGIYPDIERTCKVFYQCINQQKVREANCPNAFKFNSATGRCDNPANIVPPCGTYGASSGTRITAIGIFNVFLLLHFSSFLNHAYFCFCLTQDTKVLFIFVLPIFLRTQQIFF